MIKLVVSEYCHNCSEFEPMATSVKDATGICTIVRCKWYTRCENIRRYIEKKGTKE